jgi:hypothetical protein
MDNQVEVQYEGNAKATLAEPGPYVVLARPGKLMAH